MKADDKNRYDNLTSIEEALTTPADPDTGKVFDEEGRVIAEVRGIDDEGNEIRFDPKTNRELKWGNENDAFVELEPDDRLWIWLAEELLPAIPPNGAFPTPTEACHVLGSSVGIRHPENQSFVLWVLRDYYGGRVDGLSDHFEPPKKTRTPKPSKR